MISWRMSPNVVTWSMHDDRKSSARGWSTCNNIINALRLHDASCSASRKFDINSGASGMRNSKLPNIIIIWSNPEKQ
jgi:hypothetical protein